jgi:hypothetical protein
VKLLVCGGREFADDRALFLAMTKLDPEVVVHGGCRGADMLADKWAKDHGKVSMIFWPDYRRHGLRAPLLRNTHMVAECDAVLACPGGSGTADTVEKALRADIPVKHLYETT